MLESFSFLHEGGSKFDTFPGKYVTEHEVQNRHLYWFT